MNRNKTIIKCYRFNEFTIYKLNKLKDYGIKESDFVRSAINEKLERDLPKLHNEKIKGYVPF